MEAAEKASGRVNKEVKCVSDLHSSVAFERDSLSAKLVRLRVAPFTVDLDNEIQGLGHELERIKVWCLPSFPFPTS